MMLDKRQGLSVLWQEKIPVRLTRRQKMVLLQVARGLTDQAAAAELHISVSTIRFHKQELYRLLDADNAVTAVVRALQTGVLSLNEI